ncbi:MAG: ABC transporter ATP-binding protein [Lachnospiraceae bacterium]|nr:ABC transporter ATP-binding protein [Lachnospiraceae bacterium]
MCILKMENVCYRYPRADRYILKGINVEFEKGKIYGIIGKSGSGKTTILSLLSRMVTCTEGRILYQGNNLDNLNENEYRTKHIGVVFQGYNLIPGASSLENLLIAESIAGKRGKTSCEMAHRMLEEVGIDEKLMHKKVKYLSGGEQQRVAIARAVCNSPDILIADEPTSNLDSDTAEAVMELLCGLSRRQDTCVIIVSHSQSIVEKTDEVWGLEKGKLLFVE